MPDLRDDSDETRTSRAARGRSLMARVSSWRCALVCLWVPGVLSGCVATDAGYADVRQVVSSRTGHDVRWQYVDGNSETQKSVRELLAKPLTAENAVKVALLNSAELQADFEQLGVARADLVTAWRLPNPVAEGSVRF